MGDFTLFWRLELFRLSSLLPKGSFSVSQFSGVGRGEFSFSLSSWGACSQFSLSSRGRPVIIIIIIIMFHRSTRYSEGYFEMKTSYTYKHFTVHVHDLLMNAKSKLEKTKCDLEFLNKCKTYNVIPKFLRFKLYKRNVQNSNLYKSWQYKLLNLEIKSKNNILKRNKIQE